MNHLQPLWGSPVPPEAFRKGLDPNFSSLCLSSVLSASAGYLLGSSGVPLGLSWCSLGLLGALWAPSWASLGHLLGPLGPILSLSWGLLGLSWASLGPLLGHLGLLLGLSRGSLGRSRTETLKWNLFGCLLTRFLTAFGGPFWAPNVTIFVSILDLVLDVLFVAFLGLLVAPDLPKRVQEEAQGHHKNLPKPWFL